MGKADVKRSVRTRCPECSELVTVPLSLGNKSEPVVCPSCGGHVTTAGELLDATIEQVAAILLEGLKQRTRR